MGKWWIFWNTCGFMGSWWNFLGYLEFLGAYLWIFWDLGGFFGIFWIFFLIFVDFFGIFGVFLDFWDCFWASFEIFGIIYGKNNANPGIFEEKWSKSKSFWEKQRKFRNFLENESTKSQKNSFSTFPLEFFGNSQNNSQNFFLQDPGLEIPMEFPALKFPKF